MTPRMLRPSLGKLLIGLNVGLIALAVVLMALAAAARLEGLADEQALARVQLAGTSASKEVSDAGERVQVSSRLLAERPTLARFLAEDDRAALTRFLSQFQQSSGLDGCVVIAESAIVASPGGSLPWKEIATNASVVQGRSSIMRLPQGGLLVASAYPVPTISRAMALCSLALDRRFAHAISERIGLPVRILDRDEALSREADAPADLRAGALMRGLPSSGRLDEAGLYLDVRPLHDSSGRPVGVVETALERGAMLATLHGLERSLTELAVVVVLVAAALSLVLAGWLTRPLAALQRASERIGGGDLTTPIPRAGASEIGALAETMEVMRRRLLHVTADLSRQRAEAEAILSGIVEGVFAVDRERRIRYLNPQAASLLGIEPNEALGRFCGDVLNPQLLGGGRPCEERCPIIHARFSGSAHAAETLLLRGGQRRVVMITSAASGDMDPAGTGAAPETRRQFQVIRDETDTEAARRLRDTVLANISHEFQTPLAAQLASIELLRDRLTELSDPETRQLVLSLERGTLRLTQLIDNLLESVRIEAGRLSIRRGAVALDEVVEEATEMMAPLIAHRGQSLSVDLPYPLPPVPGDGQRLNQVFVNLLANASKFAPVGSEIHIGGRLGDREVTLWVEDHGPGLPPGAGSSLFERFVRAPGLDDEGEPEQSGMGLGLWIVKSVIERHGGRVEAQAGSVGGGTGETGTRVSVTLPLGKGDEDPDRR